MTVKKAMNNLKHFLMLKHGTGSQFVVTAGGYDLQCDEIVRLLPGRRLVATAVWNGQVAIAKLFMSRRAKSHMQRELLGFEVLKKIGLSVPKLIYSGETDVKGLYVVAYEKLDIAESVDKVWKGDNADELFEFLKQAHEILVKQHTHHIHQADLHPHNFLITKQTVYSIDYSTLVVDKALSQQDELNILAGFYAQLHIKHHHLLEQAFTHYAELRGWKVDQALIDRLRKAEWCRRYERIKRLRKRLSRNSSAVMYQRGLLTTHAVIRGNYQHYVNDFFELPHEYLRSTVAFPMKLGNSTSVFEIAFPGHHLMIKRFNVKNIWHWLRRCWRTSQAKKAWINGNILHMLGLPVQAPVAFYEHHVLGLTAGGYYIARYIEGELLKDYVTKKLSEESMSNIVERVFSVFSQLYTAQICHGDCKASNFIVSSKGQVVLIDIDHVKLYKNVESFRRQFAKDIKRFLRNWKDDSVFKQRMIEKLKKLELN
ncbi:MAG: hypothetical protein CMF39_00935 [Legionellaceae bacterium]|nr:hypothetical protein [Legionellaceae bacterium]